MRGMTIVIASARSRPPFVNRWHPSYERFVIWTRNQLPSERYATPVMSFAERSFRGSHSILLFLPWSDASQETAKCWLSDVICVYERVLKAEGCSDLEGALSASGSRGQSRHPRGALETPNLCLFSISSPSRANSDSLEMIK